MPFWRRPKPRRGMPTRRAGTAHGLSLRQRLRLEPLEDRCVPASLAVGANVNISRLPGNQEEDCLGINPINPNNIVACSNDENAAFFGIGTQLYRSMDGGVTWTATQIGTGSFAGGDGLPISLGDGELTFDNFGNLFVTYLSLDLTSGNVAISVVRSSNGGQTFGLVGSLPGADQPSIAAGAGMVWVAFQAVDGAMVASGAPVGGLADVGTFGPEQVVPGSALGNFGGIAISPFGQVTVTYQNPTQDIGPSSIFVQTDPDGLGPISFGGTGPAIPTNVGGFRLIQPQNTAHGIDAEATVAYDQSNGPFRGRLYLVYTDAASSTTDDTDIFLRVSNDNGATFSRPLRVNDATTGSQFLPNIVVDRLTGNLAIGWMDSRNAPFGVNSAEYFLTASIDGGKSLLPNVKISADSSNVDTSGANVVGYGDFLIFDMRNNVIFPVWTDNSDTLGDNPTLPTFDIATARVDLLGAPTAPVVPTPLPPGGVVVVGADAGSPPLVRTIDVSTGAVISQIIAYDSRFFGGVRVARGDFNQDGILDVVTAAGTGGGPHVKVFDGATGFPIALPVGDFFAYDASFRGGVYVAVGDVNGDGVLDVITGAGTGGGPHVKVFDGLTGDTIYSFFAYDPAFRGGVTVAAGDIDGDGKADIITGAGPGGGPHVEVFSGATGALIRSFFAYGRSFTGGVFVAAGDVTGDGRVDIVTGAGAGGGGNVKAFDGLTLDTLLSFPAVTTNQLGQTGSLIVGNVQFEGAVRVAVTDVNGDGAADIVTSPSAGSKPQVRVFDGRSGAFLTVFNAFDPSFVGGVFVG
ncbi:MAG TPA: VCBS repeat-containing protein [Gemmataceae bacterium]|nr:VCBS repeat-containing protein [Gemmataceae bacterium]